MPIAKVGAIEVLTPGSLDDLIFKNSNTTEQKTLGICGSCHINNEELYVWTHKPDFSLYKISSESSVLWQVNIAKKSRGRDIHSHGCLLILNAGMDSFKGENGGVIAIDRDSGEVVWRYRLPMRVEELLVKDEYCYLSCRNDMIILDAETGKELLKHPSGFSQFRGRTGTDTRFWTDGNYYYFFNYRENGLKVFSKDSLEVLQHIKPPAPYKFSSLIPFIEDEKVYVPLRANNDANLNGWSFLSGLLEFRPLEGGFSPESEYESKPPMSILTLRNTEGEIYYELQITPESISDLIRFSQLELMMLANARGHNGESDELFPQRSPDFNGKLSLKVVGAFIDKAEAEPYLNTLMKVVERRCSELGIFSSNRKNDIKVIWGWAD